MEELVASAITTTVLSQVSMGGTDAEEFAMGAVTDLVIEGTEAAISEL